jgi:DNA-binding NtrC family response regulator
VPATIYLVDDDRSIRVAISRLLRAAGYRVVAYESGKQLLANPPAPEDSCILLDMRMPEVDGLDLQEQLNEIGSGLPVVFLTGHGSVETSVQANKAGVEERIAAGRRASPDAASRDRRPALEIDDPAQRFTVGRSCCRTCGWTGRKIL